MRTKRESMTQFATVCGVLNMRHLLEIGLSSYASKENLGDQSTKGALESFLEKNVVKGGKLTGDAEGWLQKLEPGCNASIVVKELSVLYYQLAFTTIALENKTGIYCAGQFPHRAAVGLVVLALQKGDYFDHFFNKIKYGGPDSQEYEARFLLKFGEIVDVPPPHLQQHPLLPLSPE